MLGKSWKTTLSALIAALAAVFALAGKYFDSDPLTTVGTDELVAAASMFAVAYGLWKARDDDVSSEGTLALKNKTK